MKLNNEQLVLSSHTAGAEMDNGEGIKTVTKGKFKDSESLQKAYNSLEAEFTKRCQKLKQLEGELERLKQNEANNSFTAEETAIRSVTEKTTASALNGLDNTTSDTDLSLDKDTLEVGAQNTLQEDDNGACEDAEILTASLDGYDKPEIAGETALAINDEATAEELPSRVKAKQEGDVIIAMTEFLESYPEAIERLDAFMVSLADRKPVTKSEFEKAYVSFLSSALKKGEENLCDEEYLYNLLNNSSVKERVIKEYLQSLNHAKPSSIILGGAGQIPTIPPMRPKNIKEASLLARNIIKLK